MSYLEFHKLMSGLIVFNKDGQRVYNYELFWFHKIKNTFQIERKGFSIQDRPEDFFTPINR